ncbi:hypothetical protein [Desulfonatronum thioautotrophicum]|uniref:hypothetical protein n=1 Tax=Desulfonatronum thioautotrophicum TaxID=617001 RepID=UPI0005EB123B|nr:hypothetical protein [Desulfonatronum thioautotrophicum]
MTFHRRMIPLRWLVMLVCAALASAMLWNTLAGEGTRRVVMDQDRDKDPRQVENLLGVAHGLASARNAPSAPELPALFPVKAPVMPPPPAVATRAPAPPPMPFAVDMIIAAGDQGRAIISGRLTRPGDVLRDGSRVLSIQADGVILERQGQTRRLAAPSGRIDSP